MTDAEQLESWLHRAPTEQELFDFFERSSGALSLILSNSTVLT